MTKTQKDKITENVHKINKMDSSKLNLFTRELYMSKPQMCSVVFDFTIRACDIMAENLRKKTSFSAMAVLSEFRGDDLK